MLFLRFWRSALAWTAAMVALSLANSTFANFTPLPDNWPALLPAIFGGTLDYAARYLPVAAFAAGISAAREHAAQRARLQLLLALASVGVAVFLLYAYLGPWLRHAGHMAYFRATIPGDLPPMRAEYRPVLHSYYMELAAPEESRPPRSFLLWFGFRYHLQVTASLLAAVMALLGLCTGRWTEGAGDRVRSTIQRWLAGLGLVAAIYSSLQLGFRLSTDRGVDPALAASAILVVPTTVLLAAAWTQWVLSDREVAGGFAASGHR